MLALVLALVAGLLVFGAGPSHAKVAVELIGPAAGSELHVMTWNLRKPIDGSPYTWAERRTRIAEVLAVEQPTVLAVQEATEPMLNDVSAMLPDSYEWIGTANVDNPDPDSGWRAIFYDTSRLEALDFRHQWLSETPNVPGSMSWGAVYPRTMSWVAFRDRTTGSELTVFNAHFDHVSELAKQRSATMLRRAVERMRQERPVIVLCDCNARAGTSTTWQIANQTSLIDAWQYADQRLTPEYGTLNRWGPPVVGAKRIDWMLVTGDVHVDTVAINPTTNLDDLASDHFPVQASVQLPRPERLAGRGAVNPGSTEFVLLDVA